MNASIDATAISAAFSQPDVDGVFRGEFASYLQSLGARRPLLMLAFAPKAAGTFLRSAAIDAVSGQLVRVVHAQGGRDAQLYLPIFLSYYLGGVCEGPLVAHVHMQALPANRSFLTAFGIRPIIMLRPIADMLASFIDMLVGSEQARLEGLNCPIPQNFAALSRQEQVDFAVDMIAPWYASYFATWSDFAADEPEDVLVLHYRNFLEAPGATLEALLMHAGLPQTREVCNAAIAQNWEDRSALRFNRGTMGRGKDYFSWPHFARLQRMLDYHNIPEDWRDALL